MRMDRRTVFRDLTYEHTMEMYDRFYRFDNALILLYGGIWTGNGFWHSPDKEYLCDAKKAMEKKTDGVSSQAAGDRKNRKCRIGMSAFYSPEPDGLEKMGENHSSVRQPFPVLLPGRRIGECGGGIVCDGSERHFMGKS